METKSAHLVLLAFSAVKQRGHRLEARKMRLASNVASVLLLFSEPNHPLKQMVILLADNKAGVPD